MVLTQGTAREKLLPSRVCLLVTATGGAARAGYAHARKVEYVEDRKYLIMNLCNAKKPKLIHIIFACIMGH